VLFMRVADGRIFTVQPGRGGERRGAPPADVPLESVTAPQKAAAPRRRRAAVLAGTVAVAGAGLAVALSGGGADTAEASASRAHQLCGDMVEQAEESASEDRVELRQMESAVGWQRADRIVAQQAVDLLNESEAAGTDLAAIELGLQGRALTDARRAGSELEANVTTLEGYVSKLGSEDGPVQFVRDVESYRKDSENQVLHNQIQAGNELNDLESCNAKQAGERTPPAPLLIQLRWRAGGAGPDRRSSQTVLAHLGLGILFANVSPTHEAINVSATAASKRPVLSPVTPQEIESIIRGGGGGAASQSGVGTLRVRRAAAVRAPSADADAQFGSRAAQLLVECQYGTTRAGGGKQDTAVRHPAPGPGAERRQLHGGICGDVKYRHVHRLERRVRLLAQPAGGRVNKHLRHGQHTGRQRPLRSRQYQPVHGTRMLSVIGIQMRNQHVRVQQSRAGRGDVGSGHSGHSSRNRSRASDGHTPAREPALRRTPATRRCEARSS
jgi:hypothetical protein